MPHSVHEAGVLPFGEARCFWWRMTDNAQQLLVTPDVVLKRRDIQVADQYAACHCSTRRKPAPSFGNEVKLVRVLHVQLAVRNVAAGGNVEVVQLQGPTLGVQHHTNVPAVAFGTPVRGNVVQYDWQ